MRRTQHRVANAVTQALPLPHAGESGAPRERPTGLDSWTFSLGNAPLKPFKARGARTDLEVVDAEVAMRSTTKSVLILAREARAAAAHALPLYSSRYSRRDFTQHQHFAILVLRQFLRTDYRGIVQVLAEWSDLRQALELETVPHYSTLCYAERRILKGGRSISCLPPFSHGLANSA